MEGVKHHLIDVISPIEDFSVSGFSKNGFKIDRGYFT